MKKRDLLFVMAAILIGLAGEAQAQGRVTVQKPRRGEQSSERRNSERRASQDDPQATEDDDGRWDVPEETDRNDGRRSDGRRSDDRRAKKPSRQTERVFRRIEEDEIDYAPPTKLIEMSFRVAPSINYNTAEGFNSYAGFAENGPGVRMSVGPSLDYFFFKDRYSFSSGLWYTIKRSSYRIPSQFGTGVWNPGARPKESVYNLQYVQIPLTVKMYANNLFEKARLYIQCGGTLDIKLAEKPLDRTRNQLFQVAEDNGNYTRQYTRGSLGLLLATGVQYRLSRSQALIMGLSYQRGLLDVARARDLVSKNNIVALELGLKF